jgi:ribosomal protein L7Ae-like RNA K-turn-binding protein
VEADTARRILRLVGLGVRSRGVVVGVEQVREAVKKGQVALAIVASDASQHSVSKVVPLLVARHVRVLREVSTADLGQAVGRQQTAAVAVVDSELARGIRALMDSTSVRG